MIPFCVTTLVTHDIKLSHTLEKSQNTKNQISFFLVNLKCIYTFLIIGVLLNISAESQTYVYCFFVGG